jgi:asparagine synthase (glutamine-hydrolysing)
VLRAKTRLENLSREADDAYANTLTLARLPLRRELLAAGLRAQLHSHNPSAELVAHFRTAPAGDALAGMIATDVGVLLPDGFLTKVDRASMACGLEVRPPLVDHEFLELAAQVPSDYKVRDGQTKWLFKRAAARRLPADVVWRQKQGFDLPVDEWLRTSLAERFRSTVLDPRNRAADLIDQAAARRLFQSHSGRVGRHGRLLWALLVLACWAERYLPEHRATGLNEFPPPTLRDSASEKVCLAG